ncbi:MAG: response regulator, partial [Lacipirellulaceae bacterium]
MHSPPTVEHLLLVEDDAIDAQAVQRELESDSGERFEITHVEDLQKALELTHERNYDIVLLDLHLPDSEGNSTLKRFVEETEDLPIVVLTGINDDEIGKQLIAAGAQDYLPKSRLGDGLLGPAIRHAMERSQLLTRVRESQEAQMQADTEAQLRIANDLHDGVNQTLTAAGVTAQSLQRQLAEQSNVLTPKAKELCETLVALQGQVNAAIAGLAPPELEQLGLTGALVQLTQQWKSAQGLECRFEGPARLRIPAGHLSLQLYRISQEALHNAVRHSGAKRILLSRKECTRGVLL